MQRISAALVGPLPHFQWITVPVMVLCAVLGITINAVFKLCISLFSFWIEDTTPFQWIYNKLILVVGILFPVEIFPQALQPLLKLTPIYTVCYGPAKLVVDFHLEKCVEILAAQALYLTVGCGLMFFIYRKGVRRLYVNGGCGRVLQRTETVCLGESDGGADVKAVCGSVWLQ